LIQNVVLLNIGGAIIVGIIFAVVALFWWIVSIVRFILVNLAGKIPSKILDRAYFLAILLVLFFSLYNVLLTFAWVTLGLLLNPSRVVAYFVGFLTVFAVAVLKVNGIAALMKQVELELHKTLFLQFTKKEKLDEGDFDKLISVKLSGAKLVEYFVQQGLSKEEAIIVSAKIESFRRFRVRFLIGSLAGTLLVLLALIIFILLGVEAFRTKASGVGSVGSVLEGVAGAGTSYQDKLGEKEQDVKEFVTRFAGRRITTDVHISSVPLTSGVVEMNDLNASVRP